MPTRVLSSSTIFGALADRVTELEGAPGIAAVGTVSQSGGTPTGAVVEKGSNANGQYVRFADGTQICDFRATSSSAGAVTWTFPAAFIAIPQVVGTANQDIARMVTTSVGTTTAVNFSLWNIVNVRVDAVAVSLIAIGRWF